MRKPILLIAILAVAWTTMDAAAVPHDRAITLVILATGAILLAVLIWLWFRK